MVMLFQQLFPDYNSSVRDKYTLTSAKRLVTSIIHEYLAWYSNFFTPVYWL